MLVRKCYARRQLLIYVHSVTTLQTPDYMDTLLLCTVCLVPGGKKAVTFSMLWLQEQDGFANPTTVTETWEISALETELSLDNQTNYQRRNPKLSLSQFSQWHQLLKSAILSSTWAC